MFRKNALIIAFSILFFVTAGYIIYKLVNRISVKELTPSKITISDIDLTNKVVIWAAGCPHFTGDFKNDSTSIIQNAIDIDSEIDWDAFLLLGDLNNGPNLPNQRTADLYHLFVNSFKNHNQANIYSLMGNHDAYSPDSSNMENPWFRKVVDPLSEFKDNTNRNNYKVTGTYERYKIEIGKYIVVLMLSDRNDLPYPVGRKNGKGFPAGAITRETFNWWKNEVEANQGKLIFTCHHHMLKETTAGTGTYEGTRLNLHGFYSPQDEKGASYLYFIGRQESDEINEYIHQNPGCINYWLGTHSHLSPFTSINGRKMEEIKDDVHFINVGKLFRFDKKDASSRIFVCDTITHATDSYIYLHWSKKYKKGWYQLD